MSFRAWLSARFFLFFLTWSIYLAYWGIWLLGSGFRATDVGVIVTAGLVSRSISVAYLYPLLCRLASLRLLAGLLAWGSAVLSLLYLTATELTSMVLVSVLVGACYPLIMPLSETLATVGAEEGHADYGSVRYWGSAGFIVGLAISGLVDAAAGSDALVWEFIAGCTLLAVVGLIQPRGVVLGRVDPGRGGRRGLLADRTYLLCLVVSLLLQGAHGVYYAFGASYLGSLGVSHLGVSVLLAFPVVFELLLFKYAVRLLGKRTLPGLFALATAASLLRWGMLALPLPLPLVIASQVLHAGTFALTHFAHAQAVRLHVPQNLWATAHGLYASVAMSLGVGLATAAAGPVYAGSPRAAFLVMAVMCLPCLPLAGALAASLRNRRTVTESVEATS